MAGSGRFNSFEYVDMSESVISLSINKINRKLYMYGHYFQANY